MASALTRAVEVDQARLGLDIVEVVLITVVTQPVSVPPTVSTRHGAWVPATPLRQSYKNISNIYVMFNNSSRSTLVNVIFANQKFL